MNALLFNMPDIYPQWRPYHNKGPSLGLASIAGNCPEHKVYVGDLVLRRRNVKKAIRKAMNKYSPGVIGLSSMTFQFPTAITIAEFIKKINPLIIIVIGGYHITTSYKQVTNEDCSQYFDFMIRGEADLCFNELLNSLESTMNFDAIAGLSYKKNGNWIHNPPRPLEDLTAIKLPARDARIWKGYHTYAIKCDTVETLRGCLNNCKFCSIRKMYGQSRREYSIDRIIRDIKNAKKVGAKYIMFIDDNITDDARGLKRFERLLDAIIENKFDNLRYSTQASSIGMGIDEGIVRKMRKAGFDIVFLGMENISQRNLTYYKKGNIIDYTKRAVQYLRDSGITIMGALVNGMEDDEEENFRINFDYLIDSRIDNILAQILTPYPGTELRKELLEKGLITNMNDWKFYSGYFANVKTKHLSTDTLNFLQWKYSNKYYKWRSRNFWNLNIFKNHGFFIIKTYLFIESIRRIPLFIKKFGKNEMSRFKVDFEDLLNVNRNLI